MDGIGDRFARLPAFPYDLTVRISLWVSVIVVAALFGWGAWERRWIADDGLIVLRTVRNLLAGNGPVFNAGERVEANTSTVWTYLIYFGAWVGGPVRMEYVALFLALTLSVLGVVFAMLGTARLYAPSLQGRRALMLPAGALVYIAVPPARDFATSGLENGLVLAYLGLLWWMMVCWSQALRASGPGRAAMPVYRGGPPAIRRQPVAAGTGQNQPVLRRRTGFRRRDECADSTRVGVGRRARVGHDADRGAGLAAARTRSSLPAVWCPWPTRSSEWATTACCFPAPPWPRTPREPSGHKGSCTWPTSTVPICCGRPPSCWPVWQRW